MDVEIVTKANRASQEETEKHVIEFNKTRKHLLLLVILSIINGAVVVVLSEPYFIFGFWHMLSVPEISFLIAGTFHYLRWLFEMPWLLFIVAFNIFAYTMCFVVSKHHRSFVFAAIALFALDALAVIGLAVRLITDFALNFSWHIYVLALIFVYGIVILILTPVIVLHIWTWKRLIRGIIAAKELKDVSQEEFETVVQNYKLQKSSRQKAQS